MFAASPHAAMLSGLNQPTGKKSLPTLLLYDERGLRLYDAITTDAHEYYLFPTPCMPRLWSSPTMCSFTSFWHYASQNSGKVSVHGMWGTYDGDIQLIEQGGLEKLHTVNKAGNVALDDWDLKLEDTDASSVSTDFDWDKPKPQIMFLSCVLSE
ncbi:hypothetical protein K439DRAFT_1624720 [Ramaria rubella]|nr:hypothetical protein K439DRAFT_1624720 [Ramaria rubella]